MKLHTITYNDDMTIIIKDSIKVNDLDFLKHMDQSKLMDLTLDGNYFMRKCIINAIKKLGTYIHQCDLLKQCNHN